MRASQMAGARAMTRSQSAFQRRCTKARLTCLGASAAAALSAAASSTFPGSSILASVHCSLGVVRLSERDALCEGL